MIISDLRSYVDERVKAVDPNLEPETSQVFGNDQAGKHLANKRYNLFIDDAITTERRDISYIEEIPFKIDIYVKPKYKAQEAFDDLLDKARCIRDEICKKSNFPVDGDNLKFNDITPESITPIQEIDNDKAFRMQLSFILVNELCIE